MTFKIGPFKIGRIGKEGEPEQKSSGSTVHFVTLGAEMAEGTVQASMEQALIASALAQEAPLKAEVLRRLSQYDRVVEQGQKVSFCRTRGITLKTFDLEYRLLRVRANPELALRETAMAGQKKPTFSRKREPLNKR